MAADPERKMGARRIREAIFERTGTMLTREYVTEMVQIHDPPRWKPKKRKTVAAEEGGAGEQNAEMGDWNQPWDGPGTSGLGSDEQGPALEGSVPVAGPSNSGSIRGRRTAVASSVPKYPRRKKDPPVDLMVLAVLQKTEEKLRVYYSTQNPFPTSEEREAAIAQHFSYALAECGHNESWYKLTDLNMVSLRQCDLNLRTSIHQAIHRYLPAAYGLVINPDTMQEQQNRARVAWLLEDSRYVYELPDRREGRFQHPVISEIIHNVWFNSTHSIGCTYQEFFNPIRNETLALILTTIRYDLLRWQTGILVESVVQADETRIYEEFLQALLQFDTGLMAPLWRRYRASIFRRALVIAGIGPGSALVRPLTTEEMQREHEHLRIRFEYDCVREHP
ncbi:hypothetical protein CERSUDRAFT_118309 [Gelatoporia subvermispora B]|uniref:DUF6532 domain-containing protein n=1 Tax=Ceriporiopsis subvermispora (strain B) TaxID=914234 RepID=M2Q8S7_CERS8|nr:hypothetical protein CERSUDRAFT_118309 [Gelatoporia subvermispora B]